MSEKGSCTDPLWIVFIVAVLIIGGLGVSHGVSHLLESLMRPETIVCDATGCHTAERLVYEPTNPYRVPNDRYALEACQIIVGACLREGSYLEMHDGRRVCAAVVGSFRDEWLTNGVDDDCDGFVDEAERCDSLDPRCESPSVELVSAD